MSPFSNFTKRNNIIKNLQFRLIPLYGSFKHLQDSKMLNNDLAIYKYGSVLLSVLRRIDSKFLEKVLTDSTELEWSSLAKVLEENHRADIIRCQTELRKAISRLITKNPEFKNIMNPSKAVKSALVLTETQVEKEAAERFKRFTTVLVDYFNRKKSFFLQIINVRLLLIV